jgi:hypothetical protein
MDGWGGYVAGGGAALQHGRHWAAGRSTVLFHATQYQRDRLFVALQDLSRRS